MSVPVEIHGKRVEYSGKEGKAHFTGGVTVVRGSSTLKCLELDTIRGSSEALARGKVEFHDAGRKMDLTCDEVHYTHGLRHVMATGHCQLIFGEGADVTVVTGEEMELFVDTREAIARRSVRIIQGENEALCSEGRLYGLENRVELLGRPVLRRPPHEFECDRVETYFKEGRTILRGRVKGKLNTARLEDLRRETQ
jgi:lipopolysaccharide export system protein LptA